ncbi:ABC transporter ATP-binding protein [Arcanobacterium phocisimile]|uniref:ABC transporter ATP-binding protein n=1 Tax=Arcanobacterium phocisimile TaxID=1302235 RepID=A0ABX7IEP6_9ACTO|nr:ABC transporter ATP-binding protein [Arcanobacterium phocisimile]QRV01608.1 ABC transporter ATP-binding protein [Arcanobacterium phocisimile]
MSLSLNNVCVGEILAKISFSVDDGEVVVIVGPSGSGKTTLLQAIAGFIQPTAGNVVIDNEDIIALPPQRRPTGIMLERATLFDMSVRENVEFGLDDSSLTDKQRHDIADIVMSSLNISGLAQRDSASLSGGQAQRVALARTLVRRPRVLLLDEPLAHIESTVRTDIHRELLSQVHRLGLSALYVTHDMTDAFTVADRIIVLDQGEIVQEGRPEDLYLRPRNATVAKLMGIPNILSAANVSLIAPDKVLERLSGEVVIPPSMIELRPSEEHMVYGSVGQVLDCVYVRSHFIVYVETQIGTLVAWSKDRYEIGQSCRINVSYLWSFANTER